MFKPILMINSAASAITVKADDKRFGNIQDFIEYSKQNEVQVGNSGIGAIWHLAAAGLAKETGSKFKHVGYDGANGAITDLLGGHIDAVAVSYAEVDSFVRSGKLNGPRRHVERAPRGPARRPDLQGVRLQRGARYVARTRRPRATPDEVVNELYRIFSEAAASDQFKEFMANTNNVIEIQDGKTFEKTIADQLALYKELVDSLGLKVK